MTHSQWPCLPSTIFPPPHETRTPFRKKERKEPHAAKPAALLGINLFINIHKHIAVTEFVLSKKQLRYVRERKPSMGWRRGKGGKREERGSPPREYPLVPGSQGTSRPKEKGLE